MTVTLTKEELGDFQRNLSGWYLKELVYVIERIGSYRDPFLQSTPGSAITKLRQEFEAKNPMPNWRTLL
jgi:hypothetical protein